MHIDARHMRIGVKLELWHIDEGAFHRLMPETQE
jgi:hypothetical protein